MTGGRIISSRHTSFGALLPAFMLTAAMLLPGCSTERVPTTMPNAHPITWMDADSKDFHGRFVALDGTATCEKCHGIETLGGPVGVSCLDCHGSGSAVCVDCHGGLDNQTGAPPYGLDGESADTALAVGAHSIHIEASSLGATVACDACHIVPPFVFSESHLDQSRPSGQPLDYIAEITWHGIADGGAAAWDRTARTCSNTYCHGNFAGGISANAPVWTASGQAGCGSCHDVGGDPASLGWKHEYHINDAGLECFQCHASVTNADFDIIDPSLHVNGAADTSIADPSVCNACHGSGPKACTLCHGGTDNLSGAPPVGLEGETATTSLAVGAHTAHMETGDLADAFACNECHQVPSNMLAPGHLGDDKIAEMTWGALAGAASIWNRGNATCSAIYCHGNFTGGTASNAPVWTGSNQAGCGSCHNVGGDPASLGWKHEYHINSAGLECYHCHASTTDQFFNIVGLDLHVNGVADTLIADRAVCNDCHGSGPEACISCHGGTDNNSGAPPLGLEGETATTQLAVGAHTRHMEGGAFADAFSCSDCHLVPAAFHDPGHYGTDEIAEITWSSLAGASASWNRTNATCSAVYCHGRFSGGASNNAPVWTGSNQATCGSCHDVGSNPITLTGQHDRHIRDKGLDCIECHSTVVSRSQVILNLSLHVDGIKTVNFLQGGTYQNGTCSGLNTGTCHSSESWTGGD